MLAVLSPLFQHLLLVSLQHEDSSLMGCDIGYVVHDLSKDCNAIFRVQQYKVTLRTLNWR